MRRIGNVGEKGRAQRYSQIKKIIVRRRLSIEVSLVCFLNSWTWIVNTKKWCATFVWCKFFVIKGDFWNCPKILRGTSQPKGLGKDEMKRKV